MDTPSMSSPALSSATTPLTTPPDSPTRTSLRPEVPSIGESLLSSSTTTPSTPPKELTPKEKIKQEISKQAQADNQDLRVLSDDDDAAATIFKDTRFINNLGFDDPGFNSDSDHDFYIDTNHKVYSARTKEQGDWKRCQKMHGYHPFDVLAPTRKEAEGTANWSRKVSQRRAMERARGVAEPCYQCWRQRLRKQYISGPTRPDETDSEGEESPDEDNKSSKTLHQSIADMSILGQPQSGENKSKTNPTSATREQSDRKRQGDDKKMQDQNQNPRDKYEPDIVFSIKPWRS